MHPLFAKADDLTESIIGAAIEVLRKRNSEYSRRKAGAEKERVEDYAERSLTVAA